MNQRIVFMLILIVSISKAHAITDTLSFDNCRNLGLDCPDINLTLEEQKEFVLNMIITEKMPAYKSIYEWNAGLNFTEPPYGTKTADTETIHNAWVKLLAVMPSVLDNGAFYINGSGAVQTEYGYELLMPPNYYNGRDYLCGEIGPTDNYGNCRTEYVSNEDASYLDVLNNGEIIGDEKLSWFGNAGDDNLFVSKLHIRNKILRRNWKWAEGGCCRTCCPGKKLTSCYCCARAYSCAYSYDDYRVDPLDIEDSLNADKQKQLKYSLAKLAFEKSKAPAKGYLVINSENIEGYTLKLGEASFKMSNFDYEINYSYEPYNILNMETVRGKKFYVDNVNVLSSYYKDGNEIVEFETYSNFDSCELTIETPFDKFNMECEYSLLQETELRISSDKYSYKDGDDVKINIELKDDKGYFEGDVKLEYANQTKEILVNGRAEATLTAIDGHSIIKAYYKSDMEKSSAEAQEIISVSYSNGISYYYGLFLALIPFIFVSYIIYSLRHK